VIRWAPSAEAIEAGNAAQGAIPYVRGATMSATDNVVQLPVQPGTRALADWVRRRWSLAEVGTRRAASMSSPARRADGSYRRRDQHEEGRALDAMTSDAAKGAAIAETMVLHAAHLGVQYVVWSGLEWCSSSIGPAWELVSDSQDRAALGRAVNNHTDHVHIELTPAMAADGEAMRRALDAIDNGAPSDIPTSGVERTAPGSAVAVVALGVVGLAAAIWARNRR